VKVFHCSNCNHLIFFENTACVNCGALLAFLPDRMQMAALVQQQGNDWAVAVRVVTDAASSASYRLCHNYTAYNICNWTIPAHLPDALCQSCRLTRIVPNLSVPGNRSAWAKLEMAKRRLVYSLLSLRLPVVGKEDDEERGVIYEFLADDAMPHGKKVVTGHDEGLITLNIAEADDAERERRRLALKEPYRSLIGHFRHEVGHYYWDRLIASTDRLPAFRALFGDEELNYGEALEAHYKNGAPANWQESFVSSYATMHPWEDWAETWAHYMHMVDTLSTSAACGLSIRPQRTDEPRADVVNNITDVTTAPFDILIDNWLPVAYTLNNLNRSLGLNDAYPFVLSAPAIDKLRFVHETIRGKPRQIHLYF
jgi:hypothetical protein